MERVYFSIKIWWFESLNNDDVISVILKIERENAINPNFNLKYNVFSNTLYLWIGLLKTCISYKKMTVFLCRRHTVPNLKADGHTNIKMFKFGSDRENIGTFALRVTAGCIFSDFGSNFVSEGKISDIQKNWTKSSRRLIFVLTPCVQFALRKAIVMASC